MDTDATEVTDPQLDVGLMDPGHFVASPLAAPTGAYYDTGEGEWGYGEWRMVAVGDHCVVGYDSDLGEVWTFYTSQPVVATPTICIFTQDFVRCWGETSVSGMRGVIVITEGTPGGNWPQIYILDIVSGKCLHTSPVLPSDYCEGRDIDIFCVASPICHLSEDQYYFEGEYVSHGVISIYYTLVRKYIGGTPAVEDKNLFCCIQLQ